MFIDSLLLLLGLALLLGSGDLLVRGASNIAAALGVSPLIVGLTVVAFGTSAPELAVNLIAASQGNSGVSFGNVIGSNLANIGLIVGFTALLKPLSIQNVVVRRELPMMNLATLVVVIMGSDLLFRGTPDAAFDRGEGIILLLLFCVFLFYTATDALTQRRATAAAAAAIEVDAGHAKRRAKALLKDGLWVLLGLVGLVGGAKLAVDHAVSLATALHVPQVIIGLTVLAIGTSLPELATSLVAAWRGQTDIAVGNVVGSNIFNLLLVLGLTASITSIAVPAGGVYDLTLLMILSLIMIPAAMTSGRVITRFEGILFLGVYVGYTVWRATAG